MISDRLIIEFDKVLRTLFAPASTVRPYPGAEKPSLDTSDPGDSELSASEKRHVIGLMRVNHSGEICAQALYQGQALACRNPAVVTALEQAAHEETEHLAWTEQRLNELGGRKSLLNPFWYLGALVSGILVGKLGDDWNLGYLAETERQVEAHLDGHLDRLPPQDQRSARILTQMRIDEMEHGQTALRLGARELPQAAKQTMFLVSRVMTGTAYYL